MVVRRGPEQRDKLPVGIDVEGGDIVTVV